MLLFFFGVFNAISHCSYLCELNAISTNILIQTGFSPIRWQQAYDAMLLKKSEPDFNYINKFIYEHIYGQRSFKHSRTVWPHCKRNKFRGRKGNRAIKQSVNKVLALDILRPKKIKGLCVIQMQNPFMTELCIQWPLSVLDKQNFGKCANNELRDDQIKNIKKLLWD